MNKLLTRNEFRESVFKRDNSICVFCKEYAVDAHHILERRLWDDGGYYLNNGASVCSFHHLECEKTLISVEDVRIACGITKPIIPEDFYDDLVYDKWGNVILPTGMRSKGPLFHDLSVQKILNEAGVLNLFSDYVKYPRTFHLPWSLGVNDDDRVHNDLSKFYEKRIIVTEKLDGENTTLYSNYFHARSLDSRNHPSRNWAKALHAKFAHDIPNGWRLCCENLFAEHSIHYDNLESYLYGLSVWNEKNICLNWEDTVFWFDCFELPMPTVLYDGMYDDNQLFRIAKFLNKDKCEGYVMRIADSFSYFDFKNSVGKYVRKNHVQTAKHWMEGSRVIQNQLKNEND